MAASRVPRVTVRNRGRVTTSQEQYVNAYLAANPGMAVRWVYDPLAKPDLSNTLSRQADGYEFVLWEDLEGISPPRNSAADEPVRVADSVLMCISAEVRAELIKDREAIAREALSSVEDSFRQEMASVAASRGGEVHRAGSTGSASISFIDEDLDVDQRSNEEE